MKVTILSTADWDAPVWTNKQHIASRLAETREVVYVDSLGLRRPKFTKSDAKRVARRILPGLIRNGRGLPGERVPHRLTLIAPKVLPLHGIKAADSVNRILLKRQVPRPAQADVLWTFSPITCGIEASFSHVVYHAVDLMHTFEGVPSDAILEAERSLIARADKVIASSKGVQQHLYSQGAAEVLLWENVADIDLFKSSSTAHRKKRAIFAGNLSASKVDFDLLDRLAETGTEVVVAGPRSIDGSAESELTRRFLERDNVLYLGVLDQRTLAVEVGESTVGLIPYLLNEHTAGIFPMKVYEYLAGGLRVVSTPLQSLVSTSLSGLTVASGDEFVAAALDALAAIPPGAASDENYVANSWASRNIQIEALLEEFER